MIRWKKEKRQGVTVGMACKLHNIFLHKAMLCLVFCMALFLCPASASAEESRRETIDGSNVLQSGGLLKEQGKSGRMRLKARSASNEEGARQAILSGIKEYKTTIDLWQYAVSNDRIADLYYEVVNDNPDIFYVTGGASWYHNGTVVTEFEPDYLYGKEIASQKMEQYRKEQDKILAGIKGSWSDFEKILYVNDYLAVNCEYALKILYDPGLSDEEKQKEDIYNAYGVFVKKTAVCQGYALAFKALMKELDIDCGLVTSDKIDHAWNIVRMNGKWYYTDVTWNDPTYDCLGRAEHNYLLKSYQSFQTETGDTTHAVSDYVLTNGLNKSDASDTAYDRYFWNDVSSPFVYYEGFWYANVPAGNGDSKIVKYQYRDLEKGLKPSGDIATLSDKGYTWDGTEYYSVAFGGICLLGNSLYYATPQSIKAISLDSLNGGTADTSTKTVYELSDIQKTEGYIYGFYIDRDGRLYYGLSKDPNVAAQKYEVVLHTHNFIRQTLEKTATCTEEGLETVECACGVKETRSIAALGHSYGGIQTTEVTCTQNGEITQTCSRCKEKKYILISYATGHIYEWREIKPSTCVERGTEQEICKTCNAKGETRLAALAEHQYIETETKAPTCTEAGTVKKVCRVCQDTKEEKKPAKSHSLVETVTKQPGCASSGIKEISCKECAYQKTETLPATGVHLHTREVRKAATFKKAGSLTKICTDCQQTVQVQTIKKVVCKKNQTYKVGNYKYKIISPKINGSGTVAFVGLAKNVAKVSISNTVNILGAKFKVTQIADRALKNRTKVTQVAVGSYVSSIGKEAFSGAKKLKTIQIKSTKLTKVGANALKNIHKNAKIKVPGSRLGKYRSLFKKKGQKSTVKITK